MKLIFRGDVDPTRRTSELVYRGYRLERDGAAVRVRDDVAVEMLALPHVRLEVVEERKGKRGLR